MSFFVALVKSPHSSSLAERGQCPKQLMFQSIWLLDFISISGKWPEGSAIVTMIRLELVVEAQAARCCWANPRQEAALLLFFCPQISIKSKTVGGQGCTLV